eukprot:1139471-Pelagomonas_calceolata.AAC.4
MPELSLLLCLKWAHEEAVTSPSHAQARAHAHARTELCAEQNIVTKLLRYGNDGGDGFPLGTIKYCMPKHAPCAASSVANCRVHVNSHVVCCRPE